MKSITKMMVAVCGLASLAGAAFGAMEAKAVISIPFEFVAGGKRLPAGEYRFTEDSNTGVISLQGRTPGSATMLITSPGGSMSSDGSATASFSRMGGENHLTGFLVEGQPVRVIKAKAAHEAAAGAMVAGH